MIMEISLCPTAPPTAWADIWEVYLQNISYIKRLFMATYIISIIYPFDHNCITSKVLHTFDLNAYIIFLVKKLAVVYNSYRPQKKWNKQRKMYDYELRRYFRV